MDTFVELRERWIREIPTGYLSVGTPPWLVSHVVEWVSTAILKHTPTAQGVAFRGLSGANIAPIVAYKLGLNPMGVRKPEDFSHGGTTFHRKPLDGKDILRFVIVDDFIDTGATVRAIATNFPVADGRQLLGVFCYAKPDEWDMKVRLCDAMEVKAFGCIPNEFWKMIY